MSNIAQTRSHSRVEEILDAAEALFTQKGYDATSIKDIIDAVGIARGTLYHHFSSKLSRAARVHSLHRRGHVPP